MQAYTEELNDNPYLKENLLYAKLDDDLWNLLQSSKNREYIKERIKERYLNS
jgi:hypothetical protein